MIDPDKLFFPLLSETDDFSALDFTDDQGTDPLGVDDFIKKRVQEYLKNNLSTIYSVKYDGRLVGFFTLSMFAIQVKELQDSEKIGEMRLVSYPAVLLGQMRVDKKERGHGIGYYICEFSVGLAQEIGKRVACRYVILQTNQTQSAYYQKKCSFYQSRRQGQVGKIWMYRRIS